MDLKIKYGLIAGIGTVAVFLLFYFSEPAWMLSPILWWGSLVIYIWAMVKASREAAKKEVKLGLREGFGVFAIANAIFYVFYYFQFTTFAPELADIQQEMINNSSIFTEEQRAVMSPDLTIKGTFLRYCYNLIGGFVIAFGLSSILSRLD